MTNKFAQLKEEILQCKNNEQLFLLTKEIGFACQHYISIRKIAWKVLHLTVIIGIANLWKMSNVIRMFTKLFSISIS